MFSATMNVSEGYQVADGTNLPKVDFLMLLMYMQENKCFTIAEIRSAKALLASQEAYYVDSAIGYVQVKRGGNLCTVQCRVILEHKEKAKLCLVTAIIDETLEQIMTVECNNCVASPRGCNHTICFAIWLIKRSDETSSAPKTYWTKPILAGAIDDQKFILAKNIGKTKMTPDDVKMCVSLAMFSEECKRRKISTGMILNYCGNQQPNLNDISIFNLLLQSVQRGDNHSYENFLSFSQQMVTGDVINHIAEATKARADSKLWHSLQQGRVTGSIIYDAVNCKAENECLVQSILSGYKVPETLAIKRNKVLKANVFKELEKDFGKIERTGLILISPTIGVSPDGTSKDYVFEIKTPLSNKTLKNYVKDGEITIKLQTQIMVQMLAAKKTKGVICICDPSFEETNTIHKYLVQYDEIYAKEILVAAEEFWKHYIFKRILDIVK